jgi:coenzyme PQQ precursor peptide PqqA
MIGRIRPGGRPGKDGAASFNVPGADVMKWETPQAVDFRFGMEITMYVANR